MSSLLILFLIPFFSALFILLLPLSGRPLKITAVLLSLLPLSILIAGYPWIGSQIHYAWLPAASISFHLGVDNLSLLFLFLTAIVIPVSLFAVANSLQSRLFYCLTLLLEGLLIGFFTARDLVVFALFFEAMLIPLYFIITLWGGPQRYLAAFTFLIYMIAGSALMVAAILALYFGGGYSFDLDTLTQSAASGPYAIWIFAIFLLAFAVKTPLFPFHGWLPDAYTEAPTAGTIQLSALLSKAGIYGILRIVIELFPTFLRDWSPWLLGLAIAGVFYGGLSAWMQKDFKRLIAYSSLSHVNFILAGLFIWQAPAHSGSVLQALNHGITIAALFLVAGWLEERLGSRILGQVSGLCKFLPHLCWLTLFFVLANVALPGTNNFVGELLILFGLFREDPWKAAILVLSVILSVIYMLRWMQKVYFEAPSLFRDRWVDIRGREFAMALPLVALILWIGIYPSPVLNLIKSTPDKTVAIKV